MLKNFNVVKTILLPMGALLLILIALTACGGLGLRSQPITDIEWQWVSVTEAETRNVLDVPNPENYTIIFREDGTFNGMADCNVIQGTYNIPEEGQIDIQLGPTTLAFCGEDSLDQQYLALLDSVAIGSPTRDRELALETGDGALRMLFQNGGES
ncbi:MAG: META domain-containing protein [Anaerolineales bacterium]|nr:META domain-containing protein [Anaerolineales bacterium]